MPLMRLNANVRRRFETEHRILEKLYSFMPVGEDVVGISYPQVAERIDEQVHAVLAAKRSFEEAGILRTRIEFPKGRSGRVGVWMLTMSRDLADEELNKEHQRQLGKPSNKAQRQAAAELGQGIPYSKLVAALGEGQENRPFEPLRAIRKDEAMALIEAARQYQGRAEYVSEKVKELEAAGIEIQEGAFELKRDERLEHIALVLPAIDSMFRQAERAQEQADHWSSQIMQLQQEKENLTRENTGLRRSLERLTAKQVAATQGHT